jgi:hypothetical protein
LTGRPVTRRSGDRRSAGDHAVVDLVDDVFRNGLSRALDSDIGQRTQSLLEAELMPTIGAAAVPDAISLVPAVLLPFVGAGTSAAGRAASERAARAGDVDLRGESGTHPAMPNATAVAAKPSPNRIGRRLLARDAKASARA